MYQYKTIQINKSFKLNELMQTLDELTACNKEK